MSAIEKLHHACRVKSVGFAIVYCEADNTWYTVINSSAPTEEFISKNYSTMEDAIEMAHEWVRKL